jgi:hypothetical protein
MNWLPPLFGKVVIMVGVSQHSSCLAPGCKVSLMYWSKHRTATNAQETDPKPEGPKAIPA